jgi:primosomal protein N' (replication factor Y) (superfamily II helicase)
VADAYAEVAVTLPVTSRYTYRVPEHMLVRARVGSRVLVRFGTRKVTGVVVRESVEPPEGVTPVEVSEVLDEEPSLPRDLVELCLWISDYYESPPGEALRAALPAGSGVAARRVIALTEAGRAAAEGQGAALPGKQRDVVARLREAELPAAGVSKSLKGTIEALVAAGLVEVREQRASPRVRLRREKVAQLAVPLAEARAAVARAPRRYAVIDALAAGEPVAVVELTRQLPNIGPVLRELAKQGLVTITERELPLHAVAAGDGMQVSTPPELTAEQAIAVGEITSALAATAPGLLSAFLLHGVTGSGKTEVYLRVIAEALEAGRTALVLVPEISLTPQLAARFRARFGDRVAILHSGLSEQARLGEWSRLRRGEARIAVGARSAVFAPLADLGVIVVDEEHDGSFKQDEGVRYHARDVALVRAQRAGAVCVLGSATPSLETAAHAERGQYRRLVLTERPTARPMPAVEIVDLRTFLPDGEAMLSARLRAAIDETLQAGDQIILFLNRRGFATFVLCRACGHAFRCPNCSVSLTYHRSNDRLSCHYCNLQQRVPAACPGCGADAIERKGLGTERVAAAIAEAFPNARVARLDRDVASGAKIEAVLARVARREIDILVGTQMVTKGHDFPGVTLVGVLCADTGLNLPDFRASERTFQLLAQVAGRAGRGDRPGRVLVQTYRPATHAVVAAAHHDYASFYAAEMAARAELGYPPHGRLIAIRIDGPDPEEVSATARRIAELAERAARWELGARTPAAPVDAGAPSLEAEAASVPSTERLAGGVGHTSTDPVEVRGPVPAPLERLRGRTRWQIWLRGADRHALRRVARYAVTAEVASPVRVSLDVDPISTL